MPDFLSGLRHTNGIKLCRLRQALSLRGVPEQALLAWLLIIWIGQPTFAQVSDQASTQVTQQVSPPVSPPVSTQVSLQLDPQANPAASNQTPASLYQRVFGNPAHPAIVYLHGGPGYNSSVFEATTAQALSEQGFFVLVYDRRGEGRSGSTAAFTFKESTDDLNQLMDQHNIAKATLMGHSFGGVIGLKFAEQHPEKVNAIVLVGAPLALQESFRTIIKNVRTHYQAKADSTNLAYIRQLETMDTASLAYSSFCFLHAMQAGLYSPDSPSVEAKALYERFATDSLLLAHARDMGYAGPQGFWKNEAYTTLNLWPLLGKLKAAGMPVYGIYGKEDGLYSRAQLRRLEQHVGEANLAYLDHCSHNPFVDQQPIFLALLRGWLMP